MLITVTAVQVAALREMPLDEKIKASLRESKNLFPAHTAQAIKREGQHESLVVCVISKT
jgi:hypothetical protein